MIAPYGMYEMSDGEFVMIGVQSNRDWQSFAEHVLGKPSLAADPRFANNADRIAHIDDLEALIEAVFGTIPPEELLDRLDKGRVAHSFVRDPLALWQHEQLRARERFMTVTTPTGEAEVYRPPFNINDVDGPIASVPALGSHDAELVQQLLNRGSKRG